MQRETIGPRTFPPMTSAGMGQGITGLFGQMPTGSPMNAPQMPMGGPMSMGTSPSQGIFAAYMKQLFEQKYRPQQNLGGYQNMGGFGAFGAPKLAAPAQAPMQQTPAPAAPGSYDNWWDRGGGSE